MTASTCLHCAECRCGRAAHDAQEIADLRSRLAAAEQRAAALSLRLEVANEHRDLLLAELGKTRDSGAACCGDSRALLDLRAALAASERSCGELEATNRLFSEALIGAARDAVCVRARIADAVRDAVAAIRARGGQ